MTDQEGIVETTPQRRVRGPNKPKPPVVEGKRRRTNVSAKVALALVETHLRGVYQQMDLLNKAVAELRASLQ